MLLPSIIFGKTKQVKLNMRKLSKQFDNEISIAKAISNISDFIDPSQSNDLLSFGRADQLGWDQNFFHIGLLMYTIETTYYLKYRNNDFIKSELLSNDYLNPLLFSMDSFHILPKNRCTRLEYLPYYISLINYFINNNIRTCNMLYKEEPLIECPGLKMFFRFMSIPISYIINPRVTQIKNTDIIPLLEKYERIIKEKQMGGTPWIFYTKYNSDINAALLNLQSSLKMNNNNVHYNYQLDTNNLSTDEFSIASLNDEGSILEFKGISNEMEMLYFTSLPEENIFEYFNTNRPTKLDINLNLNFLDLLDRGFGIYLILYKDNQPDEICFAGYTFD